MVVMHGSGQNGAQMLRETGYGFDRLADTHGFVVVYPNAYQGYWDVCSVVGSVSAKAFNTASPLPTKIFCLQSQTRPAPMR